MCTPKERVFFFFHQGSFSATKAICGSKFDGKQKNCLQPLKQFHVCKYLQHWMKPDQKQKTKNLCHSMRYGLKINTFRFIYFFLMTQHAEGLDFLFRYLFQKRKLEMGEQNGHFLSGFLNLTWNVLQWPPSTEKTFILRPASNICSIIPTCGWSKSLK